MAKSKHPEVRAAAGAAEAEELKAQARAHAHANTWDEVAAVVDLSWRDAYKTEARGTGAAMDGQPRRWRLAEQADADQVTRLTGSA